MDERISPSSPKPSLFRESPDSSRINRMYFARTWYPDDKQTIIDLFSEPEPGPGPEAEAAERSGRPILAVLPHAGLHYSARGQRAFWNALESGYRDHLEGVVIIAPSHYAHLPPDIAVGGTFDAHETPLGLLPDFAAHLCTSSRDADPDSPAHDTGADCLGDRNEPRIVEREHAVELLLPGLHRALGDIPTAALVVGPIRSAAAARALAQRVLSRMGALGDAQSRDGEASSGAVDPGRVLWLVSSDGTHYGRRFSWQPFGNRTWSDLHTAVRASDIQLITPALDLDIERYWDGLTSAKSTVCGRYALGLGAAIVERLVADGATEIDGFRILDYYSSAETDASGDRDTEFVCYPTAVVHRGGRV